MKKKLAMLFVVIMILSCMPVMAGTVPAGADAAAAKKTVSVSAATGTWKKKGSHYRYYVGKKYVKNTIRAINGSYYAFNSKGYLQKGWVTYSGKTYFASYVEGAKGYGKILTGLRNIGGSFYYLNPATHGVMTKGLVSISKKLYYFDASTGRQNRTKGAVVTANGNRYQVQADFSLKYLGKAPKPAPSPDPYGMNKKAKNYSSQTRYLILVNKSKHVVNIYKGKKGSWTVVKANIPCTIGKKSTPTRSGSFNISTMRKNHKYGWKDFTGSTAFYAARLNAGYYFHSILYKKGSRNPATAKVKDSRLGKNISNSCIRLPLADAKTIYGLPFRTAVIVY